MNTLARVQIQPMIYGQTASKVAFWTLVLFAYFQIQQQTGFCVLAIAIDLL
jgi:hypothetical protein